MDDKTWTMAVEHYKQQLEELQRTYLTLKGSGILDDEEPMRYLAESLIKIMWGGQVVE